MKKPAASRFSSYGTLIAVLALVVGIAVTVEAAAQQFGFSKNVAERTHGRIVMLRPIQPMLLEKGISFQSDRTEFSAGEI